MTWAISGLQVRLGGLGQRDLTHALLQLVWPLQASKVNYTSTETGSRRADNMDKALSKTAQPFTCVLWGIIVSEIHFFS